MEARTEELWSQQASRWAHVGAPTRPTAEDGRLMLESLTGLWTDASRARRLIVLGVTPEVVSLPWPTRGELTAYDASAAMIAAAWKAHPELPSRVVRADWRALPLPDGSVDLAAGDGCLTALPGLATARAVAAELARVLAPEGRLVMRCFLRPDRAESVESVREDVLRQRVRNFGTLKWRLAMALCDPLSSTVLPATVHSTFERLFPDRARLAAVTGWSLESIGTLDSYRAMQSCFTFPTRGEVEELFRPGLVVERELTGHYELAERCPTLLLRRPRQT